MNNIITELKKIEKEWLEYVDKAAGFLKNAPEGRVRLHPCHKKYTQFRFSEEDGVPPTQYAGEKNRELVQQLVQKEYYRRVLDYLDPALRKLQKFIKWYDPEKLMELYEQLPEARKQLIVPVRQTDEEFVKEWLSALKPYGNNFPISGEMVTNRNEAVRSKSETIIADRMILYGVPYRYEVPLELKGFGTVYPDFTVLNVRTRQTFYFEHFGMMEKPEYAIKALKKIAAYESNGFWFGDGLLYTLESENHSLNTTLLNMLIQKYLL